MSQFSAFPRKLPLEQSVAIRSACHIRDGVGTRNSVTRLRQFFDGFLLHCGVNRCRVAQDKRHQQRRPCKRGNHRERSVSRIIFHFHFLDLLRWDFYLEPSVTDGPIARDGQDGRAFPRVVAEARDFTFLTQSLLVLYVAGR